MISHPYTSPNPGKPQKRNLEWNIRNLKTLQGKRHHREAFKLELIHKLNSMLYNIGASFYLLNPAVTSQLYQELDYKLIAEQEINTECNSLEEADKNPAFRKALAITFAYSASKCEGVDDRLHKKDYRMNEILPKLFMNDVDPDLQSDITKVINESIDGYSSTVAPKLLYGTLGKKGQSTLKSDSIFRDDNGQLTVYNILHDILGKAENANKKKNVKDIG